jgi:vancomycin resistance protein YoaR
MKQLLLSLSLASFGVFFFDTLPVLAAVLPEVRISVESITEVVPQEEVSKWFDITTTSFVDIGAHAPIESESLFCPSEYLACEFDAPTEKEFQMKEFSFISIDTESIKTYLQSLALKTDVDPQDAVFKGDEDSKIIVSIPEVFGKSLDQEKSLAILRKALQKKDQSVIDVTLPTSNVRPDIVSTDAERLGIKELIGEGRSDFRGSPKNRVYNIRRSLEQYQSLIIKAGEEFSFVEHLGEVDEANGYLPELVIKDNKTQPEFGGGVCQVSSTVFRAAIFSGMKITDRRNHSYPVRYYLPYGMDATIYIPKPDLKFMNNTGKAIMMQSEIVGTELIFRFFGTKDGREVKVDGPYILEHNPDGSMKTTFTQKVKDKEGREFIKDEFKSNYKSPDLYPKSVEEQKKLNTKPTSWSNRQWRDYKRVNP